MNFYRFCRLLEQSQPDKPVTGSTWQVRHEPVRFRPHPGMGFPASEIKGIEQPEYPHLPPTVRITFMGLYGVESPLPTHYIDDITQRREGYEATADFLDIFNHRLIAQYYRIWRKYSYGDFEEGGKDKTSQYLLGLAGLGIDGCTDSIAPRPHAFWRCCRSCCCRGVLQKAWPHWCACWHPTRRRKSGTMTNAACR
jgi:type VI secretion system protein ImpH